MTPTMLPVCGQSEGTGSAENPLEVCRDGTAGLWTISLSLSSEVGYVLVSVCAGISANSLGAMAWKRRVCSLPQSKLLFKLMGERFPLTEHPPPSNLSYSSESITPAPRTSSPG